MTASCCQLSFSTATKALAGDLTEETFAVILGHAREITGEMLSRVLVLKGYQCSQLSGDLLVSEVLAQIEKTSKEYDREPSTAHAAGKPDQPESPFFSYRR